LDLGNGINSRDMNDLPALVAVNGQTISSNRIAVFTAADKRYRLPGLMQKSSDNTADRPRAIDNYSHFFPPSSIVGYGFYYGND